MLVRKDIAGEVLQEHMLFMRVCIALCVAGRMEAYMQLSSAASDAGQESPHAGAGTLISPKGMLSTASMADAARRQQRMSAAAEELATLPDLVSVDLVCRYRCSDIDKRVAPP